MKKRNGYYNDKKIPDTFYMERDFYAIDLNKSKNYPFGCIIGERGIWCAIQDAVFMQYIGKKDILGADIFEGDVVEGSFCISTVSSPAYIRGQIIYDTEVPGFVINDKNGRLMKELCWNNIKVIGNIYENPDLLGSD